MAAAERINTTFEQQIAGARAAVARRDATYLRQLDLLDNVILRMGVAETLAQAGDPALYRAVAQVSPPVVRHSLAGEVIRQSAPHWQACLEAIEPDVTWFSGLRGQVVGRMRIRSLLGLAAFLNRPEMVQWLLAAGAPVLEENLHNAERPAMKVFLLRADPEAGRWMRPEDWDLFAPSGGLDWAALHLPTEMWTHVPGIEPARDLISRALEGAVGSRNLVRYIVRAI